MRNGVTESLDLLPNELLKMVVSYLDLKSAQNFSVTSRKMNRLTLWKLWSKPRYNRKDMKFLHKISHFPIRELHVQDFKCNWLEIIALVPQLQLLHIDNDNDSKAIYYKPDESLLPFVKVPVIVYTNSFSITESEDFNKFLSILDSIELKELVIDHSSYEECSNGSQSAFSIEEFKILAERFCISEIHVNCIDLNEENVGEFIKTLSTIKDCRLEFWNVHPAYLFTVKDLQLIVDLDNIRITLVQTSCLSVNTNSELLDFIKVIKKMKYLKEIEINPFYESEYEMSPEELALFKELPVRVYSIYLEALKLTKENKNEFLQILKELKITHITWFENMFDDDFWNDIKNLDQIEKTKLVDN